MSKIKVFELQDKSDNLCNYCDFNYPDCLPRMLFGIGNGNDNVVGCDTFDGKTENTSIQEKEYTEEEFNLIYED